MEDKEFNAIRSRMAYRLYVEQLPKCDKCDKVMMVTERGKEKRVCTECREIIDIRVNNCPKWCPKIN